MQIKKKIFKIIPEYSQPIKIAKRIYSRLLFLKSLLFKEDPCASEKAIAKFIAEQKKNSKPFLQISREGDELSYLKSIENLLNFAGAPDIIFRADGERTKKFGYHPVEIMWLLQSYGYSFFVLNKEGQAVPRPPRTYEGDIIAVKEKI